LAKKEIWSAPALSKVATCAILTPASPCISPKRATSRSACMLAAFDREAMLMRRSLRHCRGSPSRYLSASA
jgi:hypothetical protein